MIRWISWFVGLALVLGVASGANAANVLLLGDNGGQGQVQTALQNAGNTVTVVNPYTAWDGVTPSAAAFDLIILLDGVDYGSPLQPGAEAAIAAHVSQGCSFLATEWTAWDVCKGYKSAAIGDLLPVSAPAGCAYHYGDTWTVALASDPLAAGLPGSWSDSAGYTVVAAKPGAVVVIKGSNDNPMLSYTNAHGGTVVHLNHDVTYTTSTIDPNALQILTNAASSLTCRRVEHAPVLSHGGMAVVVLLLSGIGVWLIRRNRAA
jgi:hypothetical protein